jgi:hypothetical protein
MARVVVTIGQHPEEPDDRVMAITKLNVTKRPLARIFSINQLPDTLKYQDRSEFEWGDEIDLTSDEIVVVAKGSTKKRSTELEDFLLEILEDGPVKLAILKKQAEMRNLEIKDRSLRRVADRLGIIRETVGFGKKRESTWALPGTNNDGPED